MNKLFYILIIGLVIFIGCDDFFDEDLKDISVVLVAPADELETSNSSFTFWWNEVDGASKYNLQIVSPNFEVIEKLVLDTNLTGTQFEVQLYPGFFQWRVKAFNGSSETLYTTYSLSVDSSLDLTGQDIILLSPTDNFATNDSLLEFTWENKPNAEYYTFRIKSGDWATGDDVISPKIVYDTKTTENSEDLGDGAYSWAVQANNSISSTLFKSRAFIIDRVTPALPNQTSPTNGETITGTSVTFTWSRPADSGSAILEDIIVATDSTFNTGVVKEQSGLDLTYSTSFDVSAGNSMKYYWKLKSIDAAGNEGSYTDFRRFTVKNEK